MAVAIAAFYLGAIPWGYIAGRTSKGIDLRTVGSGGTGATNVLRTLGRRASAIVFALDFLKGALPVLVAGALGLGPWWVGAAAVASVAGHCWSPFLGFQGGKGVATGAGAAMALLPQIVLLVPVLALIVWRTRFVSLGSLVATALALLLAVFLAITQRLDWASATAIVIISGIITFRHRENVQRLLAGTERQMGEKVPA